MDRRSVLLLPLAAALGRWSAAEGASLVTTRRGTLPVLLTAPHGGSQPIPGAAARTSGVTVQDSQTGRVAEGIARRLQELLGMEPCLVEAQFHRRFLDANRAEAEAFQDPAARPVYLEYHQAVRGFVDEIRKAHPGGALHLDIHGQQQDKTTIHRGTRNGLTVKRMLERHGAPALVGPQSVLGRLRAAGYTVFPDNTAPPDPPERREFGGGYTVATYGSHNENGIDSIQLEIGTDLRVNAERRTRLIEDMAQAVAAYYRAYLDKDG